MKNRINLYLIEYAINSLLRQKYKNIFLLVVFTLLTSLLCSTFFISNSIKYELMTNLKALPDITISKIKAGRQVDINRNIIPSLLNIKGVKDAFARVWGFYYFKNANVNFSVVGIDEFDTMYKDSLYKILDNNDFLKNEDKNQMLIGLGVKKILDKNYYKDYFNFIKPDGGFKRVKIQGVFKGQTQLESNDVILLPIETALEIFDMKKDFASDIMIEVTNKEEIFTVASKIQILFPDARVITKKELEISYENIFNYKSGIFLALFIICIFTFFIIIYDKVSGLSSEERKEIGILKAIGWRIEDVLKEKFYESFIISFIAYILGLIISFTYVYIFQAPILRNIFEGYSDLKTSFELPFIFDFNTLFLVFLLSVPIYIAATIIPSWSAATTETDKVIR